jgi:DNA-binding NarL/FixJ family response regulator
MKVLIVDDRAIFRERLAATLAKESAVSATSSDTLHRQRRLGGNHANAYFKYEHIRSGS